MTTRAMTPKDRLCLRRVVGILEDDGEDEKARYVRDLLAKKEISVEIGVAIHQFYRAWLVFDERPYELINELETNTF